jgi:ribosomal protein L12E/L44/L45/RPP1/RPP2
MRKRFTMDSPIDEMKMELEFIKREKAMDSTIKQFSEWFVTGMSGLEWGSRNVSMMKAFGLRLDGLSEAAQMNVADLEDDFEELYDLYGENLKMHPLVRIPLRTCMMIYMVHMTNQLAMKSNIPNIDEIMKQNPDIARQLASAAMQSQTQQMRTTANPPPPQNASNPLSGLMSFMQQGMPPAPPPSMIPKQPADTKPIKIGVQRKAPAPAPAPVEMKAPSVNIDDLLNDIKTSVAPSSAMKKNKAGSTGKNSVVIKL